MNYELSIAVCDDDYLSREKHALMTEMILKDIGVMYKVKKYESAMSLLEDMQKGAQFHIFLLDVMMNEMDGMELAAELRQQKNNADIIFISGNHETALRGYEVAAVRYLAKPVMLDKLKEALAFCLKKRGESNVLLINTSQGQYRVILSNICYVEAYERGTRFVLKEGIVDSRLKFSEVETMLSGEEFAFCHRAFIVNLSEVKAIRRFEFELKNDEVIPISRKRYIQIYEQFLRYSIE